MTCGAFWGSPPSHPSQTPAMNFFTGLELDQPGSILTPSLFHLTVGTGFLRKKKVQELQRRLLGWVLAAQPITRTGVWIPALITNSASTNASNYSPVGFDTLFWPPCMHRRATPTYACMYTQTHTHNKNNTILKSQRGIIGDFCLCKRNLVYHSGLM